MKKRIISSILIICLLLPISVCLYACKQKNNANIMENLDGYIANISDYENLGVGTLKTQISNKNKNPKTSLVIGFDVPSCVYADEISHQTVLTGIDEDGNMEMVNFEKDGHSKKPKLNILSFNQTSRYIIVTYTKNNVSAIYDTQFWNDTNSRTYFIDKKTNLTFKLDFEGNFTIGMYGYGIIGSDCGDYVVIFANQSYYKIGVKNGVLEVKEFFKIGQLPQYSSVELCDIYGNCIIYRYDNGKKYYILNNLGELISLNYELDICDRVGNPGTTFRGVDGHIYNNGQVLNSAGYFVDAEYVPQNYILPSETLIYSTEDADYYYNKKEYDPSRNYFWFYGHNVIKVTKSADKYNFEQIALNVYTGTHPNKIIHAGIYVYAINDDNLIVKSNITTGKTEEIYIENGVIIQSIELYNHNMLKFTGTDSFLNTVIGIIDNLGNINYSYTEPDFVCYCILPLKHNNK